MNFQLLNILILLLVDEKMPEHSLRGRGWSFCKSNTTLVCDACTCANESKRRDSDVWCVDKCIY